MNRDLIYIKINQSNEVWGGSRGMCGGGGVEGCVGGGGVEGCGGGE